jgi:hypothetical protein
MASQSDSRSSSTCDLSSSTCDLNCSFSELSNSITLRSLFSAQSEIGGLQNVIYNGVKIMMGQKNNDGAELKMGGATSVIYLIGSWEKTKTLK